MLYYTQGNFTIFFAQCCVQGPNQAGPSLLTHPLEALQSVDIVSTASWQSHSHLIWTDINVPYIATWCPQQHNKRQVQLHLLCKL